MNVAALLLPLALAGTVLAGEARHPLDALDAEEVSIAVSVLREAKKIDVDTRFPHILLDEPPKERVLAWRKGDTLPRRAFLVVKQGPKTFEAVVDVRKRKIDSWREMKGIQPSFLMKEILGVADIVKQSPEWAAAMKKRGFESFDAIFCGPLSTGWTASRKRSPVVSSARSAST